MQELPQPQLDHLSEAALSRVWQEGLHAPELRTVDGRRVRVVYRGVWTYAHGPDFRDALLEIEGHLVSGSVELHLRASDWQRHRHNDDPVYDAVALHVVYVDDGAAAITHAGRVVPVVELRGYLSAPPDQVLARAGLFELGAIGSGACLPTLAGGRPDLVRATIARMGWRRLTDKALRFAQELAMLPASEVLYRGLLDGLGLITNRRGMAALAERLPLAVIEAAAARRGPMAIHALLLGVGGFLPLTPANQAVAGVPRPTVDAIEAIWAEVREDLRLTPLEPTIWSLDRVRPMNHPMRRLESLADLLVRAGDDGLLATYVRHACDAPIGWTRWLGNVEPAIGAARVRQLQTNVCAPFLRAYAEALGDEEAMERSHAIWEQLPGRIDDGQARATLRQIAGEQLIPIRTALEEQGLHQIGRFGCAKLRCFECPIAELAARYEIAQPLPIDVSARH